jgi:hypothetical protein
LQFYHNYLLMKHLVLFSAFITIGLAGFAQNSPKAYFIDGVKSTERETSKISPDQLASVQMDKDGAHYYTKPVARKKYWAYLSAKSPDYGHAVPDATDDSNVLYIINGALFTTGYEMTLLGINDQNFDSIKILDKDKLMKFYSVTNKAYGVVIKTHRVKILN